eukprot:75290-Hanusia_phi.AAC.4
MSHDPINKKTQRAAKQSIENKLIKRGCPTCCPTQHGPSPSTPGRRARDRVTQWFCGRTPESRSLSGRARTHGGD